MMLYYYCITWTMLCVCNYLNKFLACHLICCLIYFVFVIFTSFFVFIVPWRWITGTPSLDCDVVEFEPEIEHKLCAIRRKRREEWEKKVGKRKRRLCWYIMKQWETLISWQLQRQRQVLSSTMLPEIMNGRIFTLIWCHFLWFEYWRSINFQHTMSTVTLAQGVMLDTELKIYLICAKESLLLKPYKDQIILKWIFFNS